MMWQWFLDRLNSIISVKPEQHTFEPAVSLYEGDGRLGVCRCTKCGYCIYADSDEQDPPCVPRAHEWVPVKAFNWESVALADKLSQPLQCDLCGAHALTNKAWERFGCPGQHRKEDD